MESNEADLATDNIRPIVHQLINSEYHFKNLYEVVFDEALDINACFVVSASQPKIKYNEWFPIKIVINDSITEKVSEKVFNLDRSISHKLTIDKLDVMGVVTGKWVIEYNILGIDFGELGLQYPIFGNNINTIELTIQPEDCKYIQL